MNDDIKLLLLLLRYSQRRMVVSLGLVQAHLVGDALATRTAIQRLEARGLIYLDGVTVRLSMLGFAMAVRLAALPAQLRTLPRHAA
jgi:hypothetical protein